MTRSNPIRAILASTFIAVAIAGAGGGAIASAKPRVAPPGTGQTVPGGQNVAKAPLWGSIDTGNAALDAKCDQIADNLTDMAIADPGSGKSATQSANAANQGGCKLFPVPA